MAQEIGVSLNRIRILKTGLYGVERVLDMNKTENRILFESIAVPGTELVLRRVRSGGAFPFQIDVFTQNGIRLGAVTQTKCQTAARLIDAGLEVIAIVNKSIPVHDSDAPTGAPDAAPEGGWSPEARAANGYSECSLPFCIYLVD